MVELVQRIDVATGIIVTVAGNDKQYSTFGFLGDGGPATLANLDNLGLAVDSNKNLLIADMANNRIREVPMVAVADFSPTSVNFGDQQVNTTSSPQFVTLSNGGAEDLIISGIATSGDFAQTNNCPAAPAMLAPSQSCSISIAFTPKQKGTRTGKLVVTDNGYKSPHMVKLSGNGT